MTDVEDIEDEDWEPEEGSITWLNDQLSGLRCHIQHYVLNERCEEDTPENRACVEKAIEFAEKACEALEPLLRDRQQKAR